MRIGVSLSPTASRFGPLLFAGDLERGLQEAALLGYDGVELSLMSSAQVDRRHLEDRLATLRIGVFCIATGQAYVNEGLSLYNRDPYKRQKAVERLKGHVELAAQLQCMVILGGIRGRIETDDPHEFDLLRTEGQAAIVDCVEYAERRNVTLLLEPINRYETNVINTLEQGAAMIRDLGSPRLKLLPDTFHMNIEESSMARSIAQAAELIGYIHFADSNRRAPGWGHIDFAEMLAALREIDYRGPIGIEVLPQPDDLASAEQAIRHVRMLASQQHSTKQRS